MAYKSGNLSGFARKLAVFEHLRNKRYPIPLVDLQAKFGVSDDTMRRDLRDILTAGHNIQFSYDADNDGRTLVHLVSRSYIDVPLTRSEAHTFAGTRRLWEPFRGTSLHDDMENLFTKMLESLPPAERKEMKDDCGRFLFIPDGGVRDYAGKRELVKALQKAVFRRRRVAYRYKALSGKALSGKMEPHALVVYKNTIYVRARRLQSARAEKAGKDHGLEWISWPADRFVSVELLPDVFEVAADFNIEKHFDGLGIVVGERRERIVVDFDPSAAPLLMERCWHHSQVRTLLPDGWVRLEFETANLREAQSWILSYGAKAMVVEPAELREAVAGELRLAMERMRERESPRMTAALPPSDPRDRATAVVRSPA